MDQYIDNDLYERSNNDIIVDLGARFKNYRMALRLTQKEVSRQSGVSVMTIVRFERGECTAMRLDNFVALMRAIQKLDGISGRMAEKSIPPHYAPCAEKYLHTMTYSRNAGHYTSNIKTLNSFSEGPSSTIWQALRMTTTRTSLS